MRAHISAAWFLLLGVISFATAAGSLHPTGLLFKNPRTVSGLVEVDYIEPAEGAPRFDEVDAIDLSSEMPPVKSQGQQGSCVGWAMGYYHWSHTQYKEHGWDLTKTENQVSPAFVYNQINGGNDQGSYYSDGAKLLSEQGACMLSEFPYDQDDHTSWPSESAFSRAIRHRGQERCFLDLRTDLGLNAVKQRLDNGYTLVMGIHVYSNFDAIQNHNYTYCVADRYGSCRGGHAVCIVGYDDNKPTADGMGAFRLVNSWGTGWGQAGYWWMSYYAVKTVAGGLSSGYAYYVTDRIGYQPTLLGRVRLTHDARDKVGIQLGVGRTSDVLWHQDFRQFDIYGYAITDRPFPAGNMVFDMTAGAEHIINKTTDSVFVRCKDDSLDGTSGTISFFAGDYLPTRSVGVSVDPPVWIPDCSAQVFARAGLPVVDHDVACIGIIAPTGTVDSSTVVTPKAEIWNGGLSNETFDVQFNIGNWSDTQSVTLESGVTQTVEFSPWTARTRGSSVTGCSTMLTGDVANVNDWLEGSVEVCVTDAGIASIVAAQDSIVQGEEAFPEVVIRNCGTGPATLGVRFLIHDGSDATLYDVTETGIEVQPGELVHDFSTAWTAGLPGNYTARTYTMLAGDQVPANDTLSVTFEVSPPPVPEPPEPGAPSPPDGGEIMDTTPTLAVGDVTGATGYEFEVYDSETGELVATSGPIGQSFWAVDPALEAGRTYEWRVRVEVQTGNWSGFTSRQSFSVIEPPPYNPGWELMARVPNSPTDKPVKDGGWLVTGPNAVGDGRVIYAAKGYKTTDFYKYDPEASALGVWYPLADIPAGEDGESRPPRKGCRGVSGSAAVYMTRGANRAGFWRYDIEANTWSRMDDVPPGPSGKDVRYGEDMVYVVAEDTGWVYLLKGYRTGFFRYNTVSSKWDTTLPEVPWSKAPKYKGGSFLVYDGDNAIYAHQARYYDREAANPHHSMFKYDIAANTWQTTPLKGIPVYGLEKGRDGKRNTSRDGACGAWYDGSIYAFKGGNTQSYWKYYPDSDQWVQLREDTLRRYTALTDRRRGVKHGADLVYYGDGLFYALKGNRTYELWRWFVRPEATVPDRPGVMAQVMTKAEPQMTTVPNPASGLTTVRMVGEAATWSGGVVRVFDIEGRCVFTRPLGHSTTGTLVLDTRRLSGGVYLVRFDADGCSTTAKLVVQK